MKNIRQGPLECIMSERHIEFRVSNGEEVRGEYDEIWAKEYVHRMLAQWWPWVTTGQRP